MDSTPFVSRETLEELDWPWILEQLRLHLRTAVARETCADGLWFPDRQSALLSMREAEEAGLLLDQGEPFPLGTPPDIRPSRLRLEKGAVLRPQELLEMASWMETVGAVRRHLVVHRERAPLLHRHAATAPSLSHLVYEIRSTLDESGEVRDEASPELASLRKKAKALHREIHQKLEGYLVAGGFQDLLQDRYYSLKEDRYVLPIKTGQRSFVDGIVLGSSNSGATLFVEPREIVDLNNSHKLAQLEMDKEILRILREICEHLRLDEVEIRKGIDFLTRIDLIGAKARLARSLAACIPTLEPEAGLRLLKARHPLLFLTKETVVPNDIVIAAPTRALLVTGPNAGGKTAILKTVGILALMARAGMPLPSAAGSNMPFFESVFSDIGDSQSLQEDRSTFSGHIARLAGFLRAPAGLRLALLDEILIGTDPQEGSALAQAALEHLLGLGGYCLASTHFLALKALAARDPRVQNASLGFHPVTLAPSYEMTLGVPGASNAFFIAGRFDLPQSILDRARSLLGEANTDIRHLLLEIQAARDQAERDKQEGETLHRRAETLQEELRQRLAAVEAREREVKKRFRDRLEAAFQEAMREMRDLRRRRPKTGQAASSAPFSSAILKDLGDLRQRTLAGEGLLSEPPAPAGLDDPVDWTATGEGDWVYLPELKTEARVLREPDDKGLLTVEARGFRVEVHVRQAAKARPRERTIPGRKGADRPEAPSPVGSPTPRSSLWPACARVESCDLRGLTAEEALQEISQGLDRASRSGQTSLTLIHGVGKGVLREAIREHLSCAPYQLTYRAGRREEGGDGVTVVTFE